MTPEILLLLIPAGSAILASVLAQIIGGAISVHHAKKRFEWEKEQAGLNRYADLRWHLFGDVMTQLHIIDREVALCEEQAIIHESWEPKPYFAAVENLQKLIGRTRLIDATVADELLDFLEQARDGVEEWMVSRYQSTRDWEHPKLSDRITAIAARLAAQLGMTPNEPKPAITQ